MSITKEENIQRITRSRSKIIDLTNNIEQPPQKKLKKSTNKKPIKQQVPHSPIVEKQLKQEDEDISLPKSQQYGVVTGLYFEEQKPGFKISKILLEHSDSIHGIQLEYKNIQTGETILGEQFGFTDIRKPEEFCIEDNDYLEKISLKADDKVDSIQFLTQRGRESKYFGVGKGENDQVVNQYSEIVGIYGSYDISSGTEQQIYSIGFIFKQQQENIYQSIECIICFDKWCLIQNLLNGDPIYVCKSNFHHKQYICNQTYKRLQTDKKCPLCRAPELEEIDAHQIEYLKQFNLQCFACKRDVQKHDLSKHIAHQIANNYLSYDASQKSFETVLYFRELVEKINETDLDNLNQNDVLFKVDNLVKKMMLDIVQIQVKQAQEKNVRCMKFGFIVNTVIILTKKYKIVIDRRVRE